MTAGGKKTWPVWISLPDTKTFMWMCGVRPGYQPGKIVSKRTWPRALALDAAQPAAAVAGDAGVGAGGVGVPDLDGGVLDRAARRRVHDGEPQRERDALAPGADVAPVQVEVDVVRPLGHLALQQAARGGGVRHEQAAGAVGGTKATDAGGHEQLAAGERFGHGRSVPSCL